MRMSPEFSIFTYGNFQSQELGMFELLLLIYLLPLLLAAVLLLKLAVWLVRTAFRLVLWLARKLLFLVGRLFMAAFALVLGKNVFTERCDRQ